MANLPELNPALSSFASDYGLTITSGVRQPGKNKQSKHITGNAIDIDHNNLGKFSSFEELQTEAKKRGFYVLDERKNPGKNVSPDWTGGHIHIHTMGDGHDHAPGSVPDVPQTEQQKQEFTEIRRNPYDPTRAKKDLDALGLGFAWSPEMQAREDELAKNINANLVTKIPTGNIPQVNLPNLQPTQKQNTTTESEVNPYISAALTNKENKYQSEEELNQTTANLVNGLPAESKPATNWFQDFHREHPIWSTGLRTALTIGGTIGGGIVGGIAGGGVASIGTAPLGAGLGATAVSSWYSKLAGDDYDLKDAALDFSTAGLSLGVGTLIANAAKGAGLGLQALSVVSGNVDDVVKSTQFFKGLSPLGKVATNIAVTGTSNVVSDQILTNVINNSAIPGAQNQTDPLQSFVFGGAIGGVVQTHSNIRTNHAIKQLESLKQPNSDLPPSPVLPNTYIIPDTDAVNHARNVEIANATRLQRPDIAQLEPDAIQNKISQLDLTISQKTLADATDPRSKFLKKNLDGVIAAEEGVKKAQEAIIARQEQVRLFREGRQPGKSYGKSEAIDAKTEAKLNTKLNEAQANLVAARDNLHGFYRAQLGDGIDVAALESEHRAQLAEKPKTVNGTKAPAKPVDTSVEVLERQLLESELVGRQSEQALLNNEQARTQPTILNGNELIQNLFKVKPDDIQRVAQLEPKNSADARALGAVDDYLNDLVNIQNADRSFVSNIATALNNNNKASGMTRADVIGMLRDLPDDHPDKGIATSVLRLMSGAYGKFDASAELEGELNKINPDLFVKDSEGRLQPMGTGTIAPEVGIFSRSLRSGREALLSLVRDTEDLNVLDVLSSGENYSFAKHQRYNEVKNIIADNLREVLGANKNFNESTVEGVSNIATSLVLKTAKRERISIDEALGRLVFTGKSIEGLYQTIVEADPNTTRQVQNAWSNYSFMKSKGKLLNLLKTLNKEFNAQIILSNEIGVKNANGLYEPAIKTITVKPGAEEVATTHELAHEFNAILQRKPELLETLDGYISPILKAFPEVQKSFVDFFSSNVKGLTKAGYSDADAIRISHAMIYQELHSEFINKKQANVDAAYIHANKFIKELEKYPELKQVFEDTFIKTIDQEFSAAKVEVIPPREILDIYNQAIIDGINSGLITSPLYQKVKETQAIGSKTKTLGAFNPNTKEIYLSQDANAFTVVHELAHWYESSLSDAERSGILKWAGHSVWTVDTSEKFARGFEKYLATKKAPTSFLKSVFKAFAQWGEDLLRGSFGERLESENIDRRIQKVYDSMFSEASPRAFSAKQKVNKLTADAKKAPSYEDKVNIETQLEEAKARLKIAEAADSLERNYNISIDKEGFFKPSSPDYTAMNLSFVERGEHFLNIVSEAAHPGDFVDLTTGLRTTTTQIIQQIHSFEDRFKSESLKLAAKLESSKNITTDSILKDHPELADAIVQKKAMNESLKQLEALRDAGYRKSISTEWQLIKSLIADRYNQISADPAEVRRVVDLAMKKQLDPEYEGSQASKDTSVIKYLQNYLTSATINSNIGQRSLIGGLTRPLKRIVDSMRIQAEDILGVNPIEHLMNRHNWNLLSALLDYKKAYVLKLSANGVENMLSVAGYTGLNPAMARSRIVQGADAINSAIQSSIIGTQNLNALQAHINNLQQNIFQRPDIADFIPGSNLKMEDHELLSRWGYKVFDWAALSKGDFANGFLNWSPLDGGGFAGFGERDLTSSVPLGKIQSSKLNTDPVTRFANTIREAGLMSMRLSTAYGQQHMAENALIAARQYISENKLPGSEDTLRNTFNYFYSKFADEGKAGIRAFVAPAFVGDAALVDPRAWGISMDRFIESLWGEDTIGGNVAVNAGRKVLAGVLGTSKSMMTRYTGWYADESAKQVSNLGLLADAIKKAPDTKTKLKTLGVGLSALSIQGALLGINSFAVAAPLVALFNVLSGFATGEKQEADWAEYSLFTMAYPGWKQDGFQRVSASKTSFNPAAVASIILTNRDPLRLATAAGYALDGNADMAQSEIKKTVYGTQMKVAQEIYQSATALSSDDGVPLEDKVLDLGTAILKFINYGAGNAIKKGIALEHGMLQVPGKAKPSDIKSYNTDGYNMSAATLDAYQKNMFIKTQFIVANTVMGMGFKEVEDFNRERSASYAAEDPLMQFGIGLQD